MQHSLLREALHTNVYGQEANAEASSLLLRCVSGRLATHHRQTRIKYNQCISAHKACFSAIGLYKYSVSTTWLQGGLTLHRMEPLQWRYSSPSPANHPLSVRGAKSGTRLLSTLKHTVPYVYIDNFTSCLQVSVLSIHAF